MGGLNTKINCHFVGEKLSKDSMIHRQVCTEFVKFNDELVDMLTKSFRGPLTKFIFSKLGIYNLYAPTVGRGLE